MNHHGILEILVLLLRSRGLIQTSVVLAVIAVIATVITIIVVIAVATMTVETIVVAMAIIIGVLMTIWLMLRLLR